MPLEWFALLIRKTTGVDYDKSILSRMETSTRRVSLEEAVFLSSWASFFMLVIGLVNWSTLAIFIVPKPYRERFAYAILAAVVVTMIVVRTTR